MRVYHFLNEKYGLEAIEKKKLKISRLKSLNDPFEYFHLDTDNYVTRVTLKERLNKANRTMGLLCFSKGYSSPVQWAHYGDSHKGVCLGFDVPSEKLIKVDYIERRTRAEAFKTSLDLKGRAHVEYMLSKKYIHWEYEQEMRMFVDFQNGIGNNKLIFHPFSDDIKLKEVILGVKNNQTVNGIKLKTRQIGPKIKVNRAVMSNSHYRMEKER